MSKRKIIKIDKDKCDGCGLCIPNCPEGALQIIEGKVYLVSETSCDGLGACIGHCPKGAIIIEEREAEEYDEAAVMKNIASHGKEVIKAHLTHLKEHNQEEYLNQAIEYLKERNMAIPEMQTQHSLCGCPGAKAMDLRDKEPSEKEKEKSSPGQSYLNQWPIQITLVSPSASYLKNAHLLIAADCTGFTYPDIREHLLKGKILLIGCPKLDDIDSYKEKFTAIFKDNDISSVTCAHMEVPCCFGLVRAVKDAVKSSGVNLPVNEVNISIRGEKVA